MAAPTERSGLRTILVGMTYAVVGVAFAIPASSANSDRGRVAWRLAAWAASAAIFAAHVAWERLRLGGSPRRVAWRVSAAVAIGAFALAARINVRAAGSHRSGARSALALVVFPVVTAVPAFVVGFAAASVVRPRGEDGSPPR